MAKEPILDKIGDAGGSKVKELDDTGFLTFLGKKLIVRLHFPGNIVKEYKVKVTMHTFDIGECSYFIHTDAFYRKGKKTYCDYYFGNPKPIIYKNDYSGVLVVGDELQEKFQNDDFKDKDGRIINYEDWLKWDYKDKFNTPGVFEYDGVMINRTINYSFSKDLWGKPDGLFSGKGKWGIIIFIVVIVLVAVMILYFRLKTGV